MTVDSLCEQLKAGTISLSDWEAGMRDVVRSEILIAMELSKGGRQFVSQSDWGYAGAQIKEQYANLSNFASEIQRNPVKWLNGRSLNARADLYGQLGYSALEDDLNREAKKAGWTEEMNVLEPDALHCEDCKDEHKKGWVPIGTLTKIGTRKCCTNDRCSIKYRKPDLKGDWIYDKS